MAYGYFQLILHQLCSLSIKYSAEVDIRLTILALKSREDIIRSLIKGIIGHVSTNFLYRDVPNAEVGYLVPVNLRALIGVVLNHGGAHSSNL